MSNELNKRYFDKTGYGFGSVMSGDKKDIDMLRTLTNDQIEALLSLVLLGDIFEVATDGLLLGGFGDRLNSCIDEEVNVRSSIAASIVYLTGNLAEDFEMLK